MTVLPTLPDTSVLHRLVTATDPTARGELAKMALERIEVDGFPRPIPRAFLDLPKWDENDEDIAWDIAARVLGSETPYDKEAAGKEKLSELVGRKVTVHQLGVKALTPADIADDPTRGVGAYLVLSISLDDNPDQTVAFTGSPRIITPLLYAYARGELPISGTVIEVAAGKGKRSAPLAFVIERPF